MLLVFVGEDCVQRMSEGAVYEDPGATVMAETAETEGVETYRIKLIGGVITIIPYTPAQLAIQDEVAFNRDIAFKVAKALFVIVNEIRTLQGQPTINRTQFINWIKGL